MAVLSRLVPTIATTYGLQALFAAVFIPLQTERFYDLCGSIGFLSATGVSLYGPALKAKYWDGIPGATLPALNTTNFAPRQLILTAGLVVWSARLGSFLLERAIRHNGDSRFDTIRSNPVTFALAWFMQANWVMLVGLPVYLMNVLPATQHTPLSRGDKVGLAFAAAAFVLEVIADRQKSAWRAAKDAKVHSEKFISHGLWGWSRHPNYVAEIGIWTGVFFSSLRTLRAAYPTSATVAALGSPLLTYVLLRHISGVPPLEKAGDKKWRDDPAWKAYKSNVPVFWPWA
ncbi:DUF1295-domain-containing protein [Exidia glandulosa HHB12029]|uniref:DUF1295-domain-containing protein n=1 Tax=Exidia glandulosa HHB12029 TaxID=1314781 RepID=A0A165LS70_EXIGL|nr:DUF1295-domain-containing protein [Exidia glandulosa HHB12029]